MSIKVMTMVFDRYPEGGNERLLALALADHASDDGTKIWPSISSLCHKTLQAENTVRRQIRKMIDRGWLEKVHEGGAGPRSTNEYRISAAWIDGGELLEAKGANLAPLETPPSVDNSVDSGQAKGATVDAKGATTDAKGAIAVAPESSEPSLTVIPPYPPVGGGDGFDEFKAEYPKTADEEKARRRWRRMAPGAELQGQIIAAVRRLRLTPQWQADAAKYAPGMATFLRNKRWLDAAALPWPNGRAEVEALGEAFGVGRWSQDAWHAGAGPPFAKYESMVMRAVGVALGVVGGDGGKG